MTETLIRDIERHFAPLLSDDKITTRPDHWWLTLHFTLCTPSSLTAEYSGWHPAQRHWEIHKGESSLIPGSPLRTALISRRLWLVGLCLICFIPLPLCRKKAACLCRDLAVRCTKHTQADTQKQTHKDVHGGRFSCLLETLQVASETLYHTPADSYTHTHAKNTRELQCSKPKKGSTSVERVQLLIFHYCIPRTLFTFT